LQGRIEFDDLIEVPTFRDFLCLYLAEGSKRSRNTVAVCNSDPRIVILCAGWIRRFARNAIRYSIQFHADQDLNELCSFWAEKLAVSPAESGFNESPTAAGSVGEPGGRSTGC